MEGRLIGIWASFLILSPVTPAYIFDETSNNSKDEVRQGTTAASKLRERSLQTNSEARLNYKLLNNATHFIQNKKLIQLDNKTNNQNGTQKMEVEHNSDLLEKFLEFVAPSSMWSPSDMTDAARRTLHFKKMLFPLLIGVALKFGSLIPLALGKLAMVGATALIASKLSLFLIGMEGVTKLFSGSDGGLQQQEHQYHDGQIAYYGPGGQHAHRRMTYIVRGRKIGYEEDWPASVGAESRGFGADREEEVLGNLKTAEGSSGEEKWAKSPGTVSKNNAEGLSEFRYKADNKTKEIVLSNLRQSKSFQSTYQRPATKLVKSETEEGNIANLPNERRQLRHWDIKSERNVTQYILNSDAMSRGDNGSVTADEANHTRDGADPDADIHATIDRYDKLLGNNTDRGIEAVQNETTQEEETRNKARRLVKRQYARDGEGQNHYRHYSAGRRRLDEVEGVHADAWMIRREIDRA